MAAAELEQADVPKSKKGLIIMIAVVILAIAASVAGTLYFVGGQSEETAEVAQVVDKPAMAIYHQMRPAFIVNYSSSSKPRYLQAELSVMARDAGLIEDLIDHTPLVRSRILKELSDARFEDIRTHEGKEQLRERLREALDELMQEETHRSGFESVLFTNFVLQ